MRDSEAHNVRDNLPTTDASSRTSPGTFATQVLDAIDDGVMSLNRSLEIEYANKPWEVWIGAPVRIGSPLAALLDADAANVDLHAIVADGVAREIELTLRSARADGAPRKVRCMVRRLGDGLLIQARASTGEMAMADIARRLAEADDMADVLNTLCEIAMAQCDASGAAVLRVAGTQGEVVAATGVVAPARGRPFELEGSLLAEAVAGESIVSEQNYSESGRPLMRAVPELELGPVIAARLRVHGETLGVISVARAVESPAFRPADAERLAVLADHAALAVHKSFLLYQAQSADRAKGRFLATMSHELRTPLTALAGYNELLVDQVIGPVSEPQLEILERMRSVTSHLSGMIEEILSFTNLEEGRDLVRPTDFLVADLVRAAIAVVQPLADQKKLQIALTLPSEHVRIASDIDKARQILVNLLGNAVKFTDTGHVTVRVQSDGTRVRIGVEDTGLGISPEELSRLFRPFTQIDSGLTRRHGGTGLGLYISRRLATMLGGKIEVLSSSGAGSTFTFELPLRYEERT